MQKFEYNTHNSFITPLSHEELDKLGLEGWELVSVIQPRNDDYINYVFKRPVNSKKRK